jgi:uracil-DNA glycosylase
MPDLWYGTSGPKDAPIVIVGEAWGFDEQQAKKPFMGGAGNELNRMLAEAGFKRDEILCTNVANEKPYANQMWRFFDSSSPAIKGLRPRPNVVAGLARLKEQIAASPRSLVIAAGNYPLWALTDVAGTDNCKDPGSEGVKVPSGIMNWRGSMWYVEGSSTRLLPIVHPAAILRQWSLRSLTVHDLKARVPMALRGDWRPNPMPVFWAPPTFDQALSRLRMWLAKADSGQRFRLVSDIETIPSRRLIACIGMTDSKHFGMSIPFLHMVSGKIESYWTHDQEVELMRLIRRIYLHKNILQEGQNFNYDIQYIEFYFAVQIRLDWDTMLAQHLMWPGTPKGLDMISSLYCNYHWYWKEDGKEWDTKEELHRLLEYNCWDLVRTFEAAEVQRGLIPQLGLQRQWEETRERNWLALRMMRRGIKVDKDRRLKIAGELRQTYSRLSGELNRIIPNFMLPPQKKGAKRSPWYTSTAQQKTLFESMGMKLPIDPKTKRITLKKDSLRQLGKDNPQFIGIFLRLEKLRSVGVFQSHFIEARLSSDGRMRCEFKTSGTETFRWSSSQNPFGDGANLQTIPAGDED